MTDPDRIAALEAELQRYHNLASDPNLREAYRAVMGEVADG